MLTIIGLIVAVYAVARLIQVPLEANPPAIGRDAKEWAQEARRRGRIVRIVSIVGVALLLVLTVAMVWKDAKMWALGQSMSRDQSGIRGGFGFPEMQVDDGFDITKVQ